MPINAYVGLQGSGKTYEVVESVILPALRQHRRIVTNVSGLKLEAIKAYFLETYKEIVELNVVVIGNKELQSEKLLYSGEDGPQDTIVQPGDLVIIDEAFRIWGTEAKIPMAQMIFFREHRHYINPQTGVACDLVLISQAIEDVHRKLRVVVERTFLMRKIKELGLNGSYTVHQYERGYIRKSALINSWRKSYDPKVYGLYDSYAVKSGAAGGNESVVDKRQNILADKSLWFYVGLVTLLGVSGIAALVWFFKGGAVGHKGDTAKEEKAATASAGAGSQRAAAVPAAAAAGTKPGAWRLVGLYETPSGLTAVLQGEGGRYRYVYDPPNFRLHSNDISVVLDGEASTPYSGPVGNETRPVAQGIFK